MHLDKKKHQNMDINKFLSKLFGNKASRDLKAIQPLVDKVKAAYPQIEALDNDALRAKTLEIRVKIQESAKDLRAQIEELRGTIEETEMEDRASIFAQIDKLEKEVLERYEEILNEEMPVVFSVVKDSSLLLSSFSVFFLTSTSFVLLLSSTLSFLPIVLLFSYSLFLFLSFSN